MRTIITQPILKIVTKLCIIKGWSKWNGQCYLLVGGEVAAFRSLAYKLQWVGRETRAEAAGAAAILATKVNAPSVKDLLDANKKWWTILDPPPPCPS